MDVHSSGQDGQALPSNAILAKQLAQARLSEQMLQQRLRHVQMLSSFAFQGGEH